MGKKQVILESATKVFLVHGLHKRSMDELADLVGVSKKTLYNYFGSKEKLLETIIHNKMESLLEDLYGILLNKEDSVVIKLSKAVSEISKQYGTFEQAIKLDPNARRIISCPDCVVLNDKISEAVGTIATEAKELGIIKQSINVHMLPFMFLNIVRGLSAWTIDERQNFTKMDLMNHTVEILLSGILTPKGLLDFNKS